MSPVYRVALVRAADERGLGVLLADDRAVLRAQLAGTLAPELRGAGRRAAELLDALEHATGWDAWRSLRDTGAAPPRRPNASWPFTAAGLLRLTPDR